MTYEHLRRVPNTPFYVTPDEPADPRDCARYPDSIYCGGRPFSRKPIALAPEIVFNECATGIKITPVLAFVKLPPVEILSINPRCRPKDPPPPPPAPPPPPGGTEIPSPPLPPPPVPVSVGCDEGTYTLLENSTSSYPAYQVRVGEIEAEIASLYPSGFIFEKTWVSDFISNFPPSGISDDVDFIYKQNDVRYFEEDPNFRVSRPGMFSPKEGEPSETTISCTVSRIEILTGYTERNTGGGAIGPESYATYTIGFFTPHVECDNGSTPTAGPPPPPPPSPPPPPPPKKCDCMGCCPSSPSQDKNDRDLEEVKRLLRLLLKRVGDPQTVTLFDEDPNKPGRQKKNIKAETLFNAVKLATQRAEVVAQIVGIEAFPVNVPATVIAPEKSGIWGKIFAFIDGTKRRKLKSLAELIAWQSEQDAAVMGKWHQSIDIEDGDALEEGEQPQKIVLPNVAETLKEQILLLSNLIQAQGLTLDVALKCLHESSATKLEVAKALVVIKDVQEYLDYDTEQKTFNVPIQISIPDPTSTEVDRADLSKYLDPSETQIVSDEWLGRDSFQEALTDLRNAASMIRASLSNKV